MSKKGMEVWRYMREDGGINKVWRMEVRVRRRFCGYGREGEGTGNEERTEV